MRRHLFTLGLAGASRFFIWQDKRAGLPKLPTPEEEMGLAFHRYRLPSGRNVLDACFVQPTLIAPRAAVLLCHGIGETVDHWRRAQCLLARHGVASLIFNYSGYGRSTGWPSIEQCERDAAEAFRLLAEVAPGLPLSLLGFSLGSGIAVALAPRVQARRIVLCAAFTSLIDAARSFGLPAAVVALVPPAWQNESALRLLATPVLIVHGLADRLFPVRMAERLSAAGSPPHPLLLVPDLSHDDPIYHPSPAYWLPVVDRILAPDSFVENKAVSATMPRGLSSDSPPPLQPRVQAGGSAVD